jgi:hypothetical protein
MTKPPKCPAPTGHCWINVSSDGNKKKCKHCGMTKFWSVTKMGWVFEKI